MKIKRITTTAENDRENMVNLHACGFLPASGALTALLVVKVRNIFRRKTSAVTSYPGASHGDIGATTLTGQFRMTGGPAFSGFVRLLSVLPRPSAYLGTMPSRVNGASTSRGLGLVSGPSADPSLASLKRALNANTVRHEPSILMAVFARLATRVVQIAARSCENTIRVFGNADLVLANILHGARGANPSARVSFRKMPILARLARGIESFASGLGSFAFWNFLHVHPALVASPTFTAVKAA